MVVGVPVFILIILGLLFVVNVLWWGHADFLLRRNRAGWKLRLLPLAWALAMTGLLALFIVSRSTELPIRDNLPSVLMVILYLWHLLVLPLWLIAMPPLSLTSWATRFYRRNQQKPREHEEPASNQKGWDRRQFLRYMSVAAPPAVLLGTTAVSIPQLSRFRIRRFELSIADLPPALDGLTIAQVSDTHVGAFTRGETLAEIARATNSLDADLVLLTGDLINDSLGALPKAIEMVQALKARHGVFLCEGNHDLIPGPGHFEHGVKTAGLPLLVNEAQVIWIRGEPVQLLGLQWGDGGGSLDRAVDYSDRVIAASLHDLLRRKAPRAFPILLAHHPHAFDAAADAGLPLTLAGHTHGGQLMFTENIGFGPLLYRYWSGVYEQKSSTLAVSNGVGNWYPLRTSAPAEILHLTLRQKRVS